MKVIQAHPASVHFWSLQDRLWLPAQAAFQTTHQLQPEEVKTQRLPPRPPTPPPARTSRQAWTAPAAPTPAGVKTPRAIRAWQSAEAAFQAELHRRPVGGGADLAVAEAGEVLKCYRDF